MGVVGAASSSANRTVSMPCASAMLGLPWVARCAARAPLHQGAGAVLV